MDGTVDSLKKWLAPTVGRGLETNFIAQPLVIFWGFLKIKGETYIGQTHNFSLTLSFAYQLCWNKKKQRRSIPAEEGK